MSVFDRIFSGLATQDGLPDTLMINATHRKAHRTDKECFGFSV